MAGKVKRNVRLG